MAGAPTNTCPNEKGLAGRRSRRNSLTAEGDCLRNCDCVIESVTVPPVPLLLTGVNVRVTGHTKPAARLGNSAVTTTVGSEEVDRGNIQRSVSAIGHVEGLGR